MIHVILLILKIIGIIILVLLLLLILALVLILFVPVRYVIEAKYHGKPNADVRVTWLLHILSFSALYDEEGLRYKLKLLFFRIMDSDEKKPPGRAKVRGKGGVSEDTSDNRPEKTKEPEETKKSEKTEESEETERTEKTRKSEKTGKSEETKKPEKTEKPDNTEEHGTASKYSDQENEEGQKGFFTRLRDTIRNAYYNTVEFKEKAAQKLDDIGDFISDDNNKEFIRFMKTQAVRLLLHIAPLRYDIRVRFGADSPDITGKVTGALSVIMALISTDRKTKRSGTFDFTPVFDAKELDADVMLKGRIRVLSLLLIAWRVYRNDRFRQLVLKKK